MAGIYGTKPPPAPSFKAWQPWSPPKAFQQSSGGGGHLDSEGNWISGGPDWGLGGPDTGTGGAPVGGVQDAINSGLLPGESQADLADLGYTPPSFGDDDSTDYASLIGGDWEVQAAEAAMAAGMARKRGDFQGQLRQALIDLGLSDTSKLGGLGRYIDQGTITAAINNKYSMTAKSAQAAAKAQAQGEAQAAARGGLSALTPKLTRDVLGQKEEQGYTFLRDFLSGGQQGLTGLADAEEQYAMGVAQARGAAAARAAEWNWRVKQDRDAKRREAEQDARDRAAGRGGAVTTPSARYTGGMRAIKPTRKNMYGYRGGQHLYPGR